MHEKASSNSLHEGSPTLKALSMPNSVDRSGALRLHRVIARSAQRDEAISIGKRMWIEIASLRSQ
jgi:hypothetical protein